jgi:hypothetical protein
MSASRRKLVLLGVAAAALCTVTSQAFAWDTSPLNSVVVKQHHLCGTDDLPEGSIQGDVPMADQKSGRAQKGYNCGLALLGYTPLDGDGRPNQNANMAWAGHCAYVSGSAGVNVAPQSTPDPPPGAGVAVVSVSPAGVPTQVSVLRSPGALATSETIGAVTTASGRSILVVGQYGNDVVSKPKPMDVYDISNPDCTKWRHIPNPAYPNDPTKATYYWPENIHNLTLSRDGRYVFATLPLQAVDISGLFDTNPRTGVKYLGDIEKAMPGPPVATGPTANLDDHVPAAVRNQTHPEDSAHEAWPSQDGKTLYIGAQTPEFEIFTILDISKWLQRNPDGTPKGKPRIISQESGRGHSVRTATIGGVPYILHSDESVFGAAYGCIPQEGAPFAGPAQPWLTNISDPAHPKTVSQFGLQINEPKNCKKQYDAKENDSVHYHDVDDATDTTFVMASMWNAGIRVFDVRNPLQPAEVAYFNPGDIDPLASTQLDQAWGHIRYLPASGQIWFATEWGGFWVVRIEGQVRSYLGLDAKNLRHGLPALDLPLNDPGRPGTAGVQLVHPPQGYIDISKYYCTLADMTSPTSTLNLDPVRTG